MLAELIQVICRVKCYAKHGRYTKKRKDSFRKNCCKIKIWYNDVYLNIFLKQIKFLQISTRTISTINICRNYKNEQCYYGLRERMTASVHAVITTRVATPFSLQ